MTVSFVQLAEAFAIGRRGGRARGRLVVHGGCASRIFREVVARVWVAVRSATKTAGGGGGSGWTWNWTTCQRALTVANNVAIDVRTCSENRSDAQSDAAVDIAHQIAAKVPT